jgi:hypothetical protein
MRWLPSPTALVAGIIVGKSIYRVGVRIDRLHNSALLTTLGLVSPNQYSTGGSICQMRSDGHD